VPDCPWKTGETIRDIAGYMATWHVYEKHPDLWRDAAGDRPPLDPDPRIPEVRQVLSALNGSN
jgi:hypothetical protein